jgi:putative flippase GtrA
MDPNLNPVISTAPAAVIPPVAPIPMGLVAQTMYVGRFILSNPPRATFLFLKSKEAPFIVQFAKYGFCGVVATVSHTAMAWFFSQHWFPAFDGAPKDVLRWNQIYANLWAFPIGNLVAYATNAIWVFTGGRHGRGLEFLLFSLINVVSGVAGIFAGPFLRDALQTGWWAAQLMLIVTSALVNFICRKFIVFRG